MFKGILELIKWWRGDSFFPEEVNATPAPISFAQADAVAEKIAKRFEDKTWLNCVGIEPDEKYGHVVFVGIDPEVLQLKPEEIEYFSFTQIVDGVQVRLKPIERARAL